jgi:hypothetical protein
MSTVRTNNILDASGGNTATINSMTPTADSLQGFRNRLINGGMVIDQRNNGASVSFGTSSAYYIDRFQGRMMTGSGHTIQRSTTAPTGFTNSTLVTIGTGGSPASGDRNQFAQAIEGFNVADLAWGTASAKTVTLSFWVRSSLTGTFSGNISNNASNRSYPFTYSISSANTFEQKSVTITGDTSGTWLTDNGVGLYLYFNLGSGSTYLGTAGAWAAADYRGSTGSVSVVGTSSATWYITGVQLEVGSVATPFERRDYGRELILCQRYYEKSYAVDTAVGTGLAAGIVGFNTPLTGTGDIPANISFKVTKRANPTLTVYNAVSGASGAAYRTSDAASISVTAITYVGTNGGAVFTLASGSVNNYLIHWTAAIEL